MKNRIVIAFVALLTAVEMAAQTGSQKMHDLLTAFGESGEYNVKKGEEGPNQRSFFFTEVWGTDIKQLPPGTNIQNLFRKHLADFFKAFSQYSDEAIETYCHDGTENDPMMPGLKVLWSDKSREWEAGIEMPFFKPTDNVRFILFDESDGQRRLFLMTWEQIVNRDSVIGETIVTTGNIEEYWGYKPKHSPFVAPYQKKDNIQMPEVSAEHAVDYDELLAKVKRTGEIFNRESWNGRNAAAVVIHKLSDTYAGILTMEQYNKLIDTIDPLMSTAKDKSLQQVLGHACYNFYKKSEHFQQPDTLPEQGSLNTYSVTLWQRTKMARYNSVMINEGQPVTFKVKGRAPMDAKKVSVARHPSRESVGDYPVKNGHFEFTLTLPKDEVLHIYTSRNDSNQEVYVCVDNVSLTLDLTCHGVRGSHQNKMLADSLSSILNGNMEQLRGIISRHYNDILSAFALYECYSEMSLDELRPYLKPAYAYSRHPLLAPVSQYASGLWKRNPGTLCPEAEVIDADNVRHQLSQYTHGHDMTLLCFWDSNPQSTYQIERLCRLHEKYPDLNIVTVGIDLYPKHWCELVDELKMTWTNLLAPDGWESAVVRDFGLYSLPECLLLSSDGMINATPTNIDNAVRTIEAIYNERLQR